MVNAVWKWVAMLAVGIVIGGVPSYITLASAAHNEVSIADVDREITVQNAAIVQKIDDLKDQVSMLSAQIQQMNRTRR